MRALKVSHPGLAVAVALVALGGALSPPGEAGGAATATASKAGPQAGLYRGKTAQGARVSFTVKRGEVTGPAYTVYRRGCGVRITFPNARGINGKGRFFFGRRSSDFVAGRFVAPGKVRGTVAVDFSGSSCGGNGVREVRFRARRAS